MYLNQIIIILHLIALSATNTDEKNKASTDENLSNESVDEFHLMDGNRDGYLSKEEVYEYFADLKSKQLLNPNKTLDDDDINNIWLNADTNKDGFIT